MASTNTIQYLTRKEIDIKKWDDCIEHVPNGMIYARSFYLDALCTHWHALVMNDYEAVMPLPWRKKWSFQYLYQPYFIPALGVFGSEMHTAQTDTFLNQIPKKFKFWEIDLNDKCIIKNIRALKLKERSNFFLSLAPPYQIITAKYKRLAKRKIALAEENGFVVEKNVATTIIIEAYAKFYEEKNRLIPPDAYTRLAALLQNLPAENYKTFIVKKQETLAAFYLLLADSKNIYSLLGGSTEEGKKYGAFYLATDAAIKEFAAAEKTFRFEGSDVEGIAFFNQQFGSSPVNYWHIKKNKLPWPVNYFK